ncbi:MAG: NAD-dependent epimerase [Gemmatimonadaceae bacterium]|nr:NAD-dependent epimerase [Gemmatimonadaceae bacterium]
MDVKTILVTGAAGFIGFHLAQRLLARGDRVIGLDNLNEYYDPALKHARLAVLRKEPDFDFRLLDLADDDGMRALFDGARFDAVAHLAAQAGVRYSLQNPHAYVKSNVQGFLNILEGCRHHAIPHLVYASTSSVYGASTAMPFSVHKGADHPLTIYAATKRADELMAHSYASLFGIPCTGLRFFTVYGPYGRPDMALFIFLKAMLAGETIPVFNHGEMQRDFTYVGDIVEGFVRAIDHPATPNPHWDGANPDPATSAAPYRLYNIGNQLPVRLLDMIRLLEKHSGVTARLEMLPMQPGDVPATWADSSDLARDLGFAPQTSLDEGVGRFVAWYRAHYAA